MGRPLNKRFFGANAKNNLKVQFFNGTASVPGYIVKQVGSKKFVVKEFGGTTKFICRLVEAESASLTAGQMSITVKLDNGTVAQVSKITAHKVTALGVSHNWSFSSSTTDGAVEIEEAGTSEAVATGADELEGDEE